MSTEPEVSTAAPVEPEELAYTDLRDLTVPSLVDLLRRVEDLEREQLVIVPADE